MDVDIAGLLGAIVENSGGSVEIPLDVLERVVNDPIEKYLTIDLNEEKMVLVIGMANAEDIPLEETNE